MAIEDYWASTARNAKDVAQYFVYPVFKIAALAYTKDFHKANLLAGAASTVFYAGLTSVFLGREMDGFDRIVRPAVAAELGKRPEDLKFSDYLDSKNPVVQKRMKLFKEENVTRYMVSMMPMLPAVMDKVGNKVLPGHTTDRGEGESFGRYNQPKPNASAMEHIVHGHNLWDTAVFAGVAGLWMNETFATEKTFAYQGRKELENNDSLGLKIGPNNIAGLFNRMRGDCKQEMIYDKQDREKIWPLFELLSKKVNQDDKIGLSEMAYLMGMGKLNVFARDDRGREVKDENGHRIIDQQAWDRALHEIERVETKGLAGIAEENRKNNKRETPHDHGFVSKLGRGVMDAQFGLFSKIVGRREKFVENISPRDPGETPLSVA